jgi:hypothetical protein
MLDARWREIVQGYSGLGLTFLSDRLPAIHGAAVQMIPLREQNRYLAGPWKNTLLHGMAWYVSVRGFSKGKPYSRRAPS